MQAKACIFRSGGGTDFPAEGWKIWAWKGRTEGLFHTPGTTRFGFAIKNMVTQLPHCGTSLWALEWLRPKHMMLGPQKLPYPSISRSPGKASVRGVILVLMPPKGKTAHTPIWAGMRDHASR